MLCQAEIFNRSIFVVLFLQQILWKTKETWEFKTVEKGVPKSVSLSKIVFVIRSVEAEFLINFLSLSAIFWTK